MKRNLKKLDGSQDYWKNHAVMKSGQRKIGTLLYKIALSVIFICNLTMLLRAQQISIFNAQNSGLPNNEITAMAIDLQDNKWFGTYYGEVVKFDDTNWTVYNKSNLGLTGDYIKSIAIDSLDNVWIGTVDLNTRSYGELLKFDNTNWTVYNSTNSGLPSAGITDISIDELGNKWIGTDGRGIVKFDDTNWTVYNSANTGLPLDNIGLIEMDKNGNMWINSGFNLFKFETTQWTSFEIPDFGTGEWGVEFEFMVIDEEGKKWIGTMEDSDLRGRVIKFENDDWSYYNNTNSGLPLQFAMSCTIDTNGNKWFGMSDWWHNQALVKYDGNNWIVFNSSNSDLPEVFIRSMVSDKKGNIWLGTASSGVVKFSENEITTGLNDNMFVSSNDFTVYPNPANDFITIDGLQSGTFEIFNSSGSVLRNLEIDGALSKVDVSNLPDGMYTIRVTAKDKVFAKKFIKSY